MINAGKRKDSPEGLSWQTASEEEMVSPPPSIPPAPTFRVDVASPRSSCTFFATVRGFDNAWIVAKPRRLVRDT